MLGKVKQWLGIEGVKLELIIPDEYPRGATLIKGTIRLQSMQPQTVTRIKVVLIERYTRGKGAEKRIDEYELGAYVSDQLVEVPANESVEIPFSLPFRLYLSEVDELEAQNVVFKGLAFVAKKLRSVSSVFRLEAEAKVSGVALHPFDKKEIKLK
ncbi:MAG: sporulation protein [Saprospiraceae bacterium]|jgi:hypothetical protein|nr:sporulation protein [Saprospiraceae bacterium]MDP4998315.1 sporulation protein [Saprospiraceae bacterium]